MEGFFPYGSKLHEKRNELVKDRIFKDDHNWTDKWSKIWLYAKHMMQTSFYIIKCSERFQGVSIMLLQYYNNAH